MVHPTKPAESIRTLISHSALAYQDRHNFGHVLEFCQERVLTELQKIPYVSMPLLFASTEQHQFENPSSLVFDPVSLHVFVFSAAGIHIANNHTPPVVRAVTQASNVPNASSPVLVRRDITIRVAVERQAYIFFLSSGTIACIRVDQIISSTRSTPPKVRSNPHKTQFVALSSSRDHFAAASASGEVYVGTVESLVSRHSVNVDSFLRGARVVNLLVSVKAIAMAWQPPDASKCTLHFASPTGIGHINYLEEFPAASQVHNPQLQQQNGAAMIDVKCTALSCSQDGSTLFVCDTDQAIIAAVKVSPSDSALPCTLVCGVPGQRAPSGGEDGDTAEVRMLCPVAVAAAGSGACYVCDSEAHSVKVISSPSALVQVLKNMRTFAGVFGYNLENDKKDTPPMIEGLLQLSSVLDFFREHAAQALQYNTTEQSKVDSACGANGTTTYQSRQALSSLVPQFECIYAVLERIMGAEQLRKYTWRPFSSLRVEGFFGQISCTRNQGKTVVDLLQSREHVQTKQQLQVLGIELGLPGHLDSHKPAYYEQFNTADTTDPPNPADPRDPRDPPDPRHPPARLSTTRKDIQFFNLQKTRGKKPVKPLQANVQFVAHAMMQDCPTVSVRSAFTRRYLGTATPYLMRLLREQFDKRSASGGTPDTPWITVHARGSFIAVYAIRSQDDGGDGYWLAQLQEDVRGRRENDTLPILYQRPEATYLVKFFEPIEPLTPLNLIVGDGVHGIHVDSILCAIPAADVVWVDEAEEGQRVSLSHEAHLAICAEVAPILASSEKADKQARRRSSAVAAASDADMPEGLQEHDHEALDTPLPSSRLKRTAATEGYSAMMAAVLGNVSGALYN
jgi:hypothetical protein